VLSGGKNQEQVVVVVQNTRAVVLADMADSMCPGTTWRMLTPVSIVVQTQSTSGCHALSNFQMTIDLRRSGGVIEDQFIESPAIEQHITNLIRSDHTEKNDVCVAALA